MSLGSLAPRERRVGMLAICSRLGARASAGLASLTVMGAPRLGRKRPRSIPSRPRPTTVTRLRRKPLSRGTGVISDLRRQGHAQEGAHYAHQPETHHHLGLGPGPEL